MQVNQASLTGIFTGFQNIFNGAFAKATPLWDKVATKVPSSTGEESYKWLGDIPTMKEWIGDREIQNLGAYDYTIKNKDFEMTIAVKKNDIQDDKLGIYRPLVEDLGNAAAVYPDEMVFGLLANGFKGKCYDGKAFFAEDHPVGQGKDKQSVSNKGTGKLTVENYGKARSTMMGFKNGKGKSLRVKPTLLVVPPELEGKGREILYAEQINGTTNVYKGTAELLVVPELSGEAWFLLDTSRPLKPFIFQEREAAKLDSMDKPNDESVFWRNEYTYGVNARGNAGYAYWQMAYGSDGTE